MAVAATLADSGSNSADQANYDFNSVAPTNGDLYLAFCGSTKSGGGDLPTLSGTNGFSGTWTQIQTVVAGVQRDTVFWSVATSGTAGVITANHGGTSQAGFSWALVRAAGANTSTPVTQSKTATGTSATPSVTLDSSPDAANAVFGSVGGGTGLGAITEGGGYSELFEATTGSGVAVHEVEWIASNQPDAVVDWSSTSNAWGAIGIEIAVAGAATTRRYSLPLTGVG